MSAVYLRADHQLHGNTSHSYILYRYSTVGAHANDDDDYDDYEDVDGNAHNDDDDCDGCNDDEDM